MGLSAVVGVAFGLVLATVGGARRTDSSYGRFLREQKAVDAFIATPPIPGVDRLDLEAVERLPYVAEAARSSYVPVGGRTDAGRVVSSTDLGPISSADGRFGFDLNRPKVLEGRAPDRARPDEVAVGFVTAQRLDLRVGSTVTVRLARSAQLAEFFATSRASDLWDFARGPEVTLRVVGIEAAPGGFPPLSGRQPPPLFLTPAFHDAYMEGVLQYEATVIRLKNPGLLPEFKAAVGRLAAGKAPAIEITQEDQAHNVHRSMHQQAIALWVLAGVGALAALLVLGQALARQSYLDSTGYPTLRALGMTTGQLWLVGMARAASIALPAAVVAAVVAVALSPLFPIGLARLAEPNPGVHVDLLVVLGGAVAVIPVVLSVVALPAWSAARARRAAPAAVKIGPERRSAVADGLARLGFPPPMVAGVRMALEPGRGEAAVPVRSTLAGATLTVAAIAAALCVGASLQHLVGTPRLYGHAWDATLGSRVSPDVSDQVVPRLAANPSLAAVAAGTVVEIEVARARVSALAVEPVKGPFPTVLLEGRAPEGPDEIVFGSRSLRAAGARVGDRVTVRSLWSSGEMTVVGRAVFPDLGDRGRLGEGAALTFEGLQRLLPSAPRNIFYVSYAPGADPDATVRELQQSLGRLGVGRTERPADLANFGRVEDLPRILAGIVGVLGAAMLVHALVSSIRRRRRDLAILKSLGLVRRQLFWAVAWQAMATTIFAVVVGLPLGVAAGRWAWVLFAEQLGVASEPVIPLPPILLIGPLALVLANLVAAFPARAAGRVQPALALRTE